MSNIIFLGASGFVGHPLAALLQKHNLPVQAYRSSEIDLLSPLAEEKLLSVLDSDSVLIASVRAPYQEDGVQQACQDERMGEVIARGLHRKRIKKFIYFSTSAVYGDSRSRLAVAEDADTEPCTPYARAKLTTEKLIMEASAESGTPVYVLRIGTIYGPGHSVPPYGPDRFIQSLFKEGTVKIYGDGSEKRDYIYVLDLAEIVLRFTLQDLSPGIYNIASQCLSFREILDQLREVLPTPFKVEWLERKISKTDVCLDTRKLQRTIPGLPFTEFRTALKKTISDFQTLHA